MKNRAPSASVDGDAATSEPIRLGLVEIVWSDDGARYRIVENFAGLNAALRKRQTAQR